MTQRTLNVPLEVKPESAARLASLIEAFKASEEKPADGANENFERVSERIPDLHFMSMCVFESEQYDPLFMIEANFDGEAGPFWAALETLAAETIREMIRCCREPLDRHAELYRSVTRPGSRAPVAPYLEARTQRPSVFHHGNRGLARDRIRQDAALFRAVRVDLDAPKEQGPDGYRRLEPIAVHARLRDRMRSEFLWLDEPAPVRITKLERAADIGRLVGIAALILLVLSLPGIVLAALAPTTEPYVIVVTMLAALLFLYSWMAQKSLKGTGVTTSFSFWGYLWRNIVVVLIGLFAILAVMIAFCLAGLWVFDLAFSWIPVMDVLPGSIADWWWLVTETVLLGQLSLVFIVTGVVAWLRSLEKRDSTRHAPLIDEVRVTEMERREDWIVQNHMVSVVNIRPGILRTFIIRFGHATLGRLLRVIATDGRLGSMRTIHFAHWAFQNNFSRLVFFSNFDHSWGSYLDDFIEKAHAGLTIAWGCGIGFPPTRFLVYDGASHGRLFKNWALASRTPSRFWYSAYPDLSVDQIERNHRVANGLRRTNLDGNDARAWMRDL